jgi:hypothetical protein
LPTYENVTPAQESTQHRAVGVSRTPWFPASAEMTAGSTHALGIEIFQKTAKDVKGDGRAVAY